jgi:hypothetical protein
MPRYPGKTLLQEARSPSQTGIDTAHELLEKQYGGVVFVWEIYMKEVIDVK